MTREKVQDNVIAIYFEFFQRLEDGFWFKITSIENDLLDLHSCVMGDTERFITNILQIVKDRILEFTRLCIAVEKENKLSTFPIP